MKIKDHPMAKYSLVKDFDICLVQAFGQLTEEQRDYEIVGTTVKTIRGDRIRVYIIASPDTMKLWDLKPKKFRSKTFEPIS